MMLDKMNGNTKWADAKKKELLQLHDYTMFDNYSIGKEPPGYKGIWVHLSMQ